METLLGVLIAVWLIVSACIMPWVNRRRVLKMEQTLEDLKHAVRTLTASAALDDSAQAKTQEPEQTPAPETGEPSWSVGVDLSASADRPDATAAARESVQPLPSFKSPGDDAESFAHGETRSANGFEQQFGARLPVWIGGIALALSGFFLVRYSIENDLLSPAVRVILGAVFGFAMLYGGDRIRQNPGLADSRRIAQSLSGAGIAVLYVASFASVRLYDLIPPAWGFLAMAAVTLVALVLSLRHGPPIALLGMVGGFVTPALLSQGEGNAFSLFVYLYFTASGLLIVVRRSGWWWISVPTVAISMLWVLVWLFTRYTPGDSLWLGLFLAAISATLVMISGRMPEEGRAPAEASRFKWRRISICIGPAGALLLMGLIAGRAGFGMTEWGLFALLAGGGIGLAYFNPAQYGFVPWISMAVNAVMLFSWDADAPLVYAGILSGFFLLYSVSGSVLVWRTRVPLLWAGLVGATQPGYFLLAYYRLHEQAPFDSIPGLWGGLGLLLAVFMVSLLMRVSRYAPAAGTTQRLLAVFAIAASILVSLALTIELEREFLSVAFSMQAAAVAWIARRVRIPALRWITAVLGILFGVLLVPQILLMVQLTAYSLVEARLRILSTVPIVEWPFFQLGVPALMFLFAALELRRERDDRSVAAFETAAIMLIAVMGYYLTRNGLHADSNVLFIRAGFFERGLITNILYVYGLFCFYAGHRFSRDALVRCGMVICGIALFRVVYFDLLLYNPLWSVQKVAGWTGLNTLLLPFGLTVVWNFRALSGFLREGWIRVAAGINILSLLLVFVLLSLNVRFFFHGEALSSGGTGNAEIYTYSVVWLLFGLVLLLAGVLRRNPLLRYASLALVLLTVAKVFLYDASELQGLYRIFSFMGLGLSLLGLSYFYSRFVFVSAGNSADSTDDRVSDF